MDQIQTPDWYLAMVFDRHSFRELGCDLVWRRVIYLVVHRTSFVGVAVYQDFSTGGLTVLLSRKPGKEGSETESSEKQKAPGRIPKVNSMLSLAS